MGAGERRHARVCGAIGFLADAVDGGGFAERTGGNDGFGYSLSRAVSLATLAAGDKWAGDGAPALPGFPRKHHSLEAMDEMESQGMRVGMIRRPRRR
jgi:hypothetical protein